MFFISQYFYLAINYGNCFPFFENLFQNENRALRLRETATAAQYLDETSASTSPAQNNGVQLGFLMGDTSPRLTFDYFDEAGYIQRGGLRTGEDPYQRNRFNQQASDQLPSNRAIPDTRNQM